MSELYSDWGHARLVRTESREVFCECCGCCEGYEDFDLPESEWYWKYCGPVHMDTIYRLEDNDKKLFAYMNKLGKEPIQYDWSSE